MPTNERGAPGGGRCPICGKPADPRARPFCSKRCADIDLGRWLGGRYAIGGHADAEEDAPPEGVPPSGREREHDS